MVSHVLSLLTQVFASLGISIVASILVVRYANALERASSGRLAFVCGVLLIVSVVVTLLPLLIPSPSTLRSLTQQVRVGVLLLGIESAAISLIVGVVVFVCPTSVR